MIDVAILGAGASGLFAAAHLKDKRVVLFEHNPKIAQKIKISGGGRCNVTNERLGIDNFVTSTPDKAWQILKRFDNTKLLSWLHDKGCEPVKQKKDQFFCPKSSQELIEILRSETNASIHTDTEVLDLAKIGDHFLIKTARNEMKARAVLVATGGLSYKKIGASGIGYEIAKNFGLEVTPLRPALVGLTVQKEQFWFKELSGIAFEATVRVGKKEFRDNILFAHRGISGPAILNASLYWEKGAIEIAFLKRLPRFVPHKQISSQIPLPKRFVKRFLQVIGLQDKRYEQLGVNERKRLRLFESYSFAPAGTFGYERAEVTKGGVHLQELDKCLQSVHVPGLFFAGEVLDVTGELGGYNFQWAFSSGYSAAKGCHEYLGNH
ncbi:NAD(P)/FAD-dependent oxidoreductase [Nitratiruptor sp. SB155-2]|uniref:NAD(P)/FAD-dependent oxidoreductase n=1 Tax=Nitratiruptor sp. (strain SB155-2) TaxID=387092 RepID=UPI0001587429|nr:aminoacetone oxidase family FAD-binding enzyme [Nitratiruptor sp. SB155-2]BAF70205.1 conserved hypothetical protein [Nitratiruptor sp. SB155-2]